MIGEKFNYDDTFIRDITVSILDTLEGRVRWVNKFTSGDVEVNVPFYYSLTGNDRFLLDSFVDDVVSSNRMDELNSDIIPRGHLTLTNWQIRSEEFRNPNIWLRSVVENNKEIKKVLNKLKAIPITATYDLVILLKSEIDVFKCTQSITNTLWLYKYMYFEHNYMHIDAVMTQPDSNTMEITREQNLKSDSTIKISMQIEVQSYYPSFITEQEIRPYRTRWYNNIKDIKSQQIKDSNPNGNNDLSHNI